MPRIRDHAGLTAGVGPGFVAHALDRHGEQRHRDALAGRQQHVHLARVRHRRDLVREVDQLVGGVAHRRDGHDDVVARLAGLDDALGDALDALGVGDARASVFLDDQAHAHTPRGAGMEQSYRRRGGAPFLRESTDLRSRSSHSAAEVRTLADMTDARPGWGEERTRTVAWHDPKPALALVATMSGLDYLRGIRDGVVPPPPDLDAARDGDHRGRERRGELHARASTRATTTRSASFTAACSARCSTPSPDARCTRRSSRLALHLDRPQRQLPAGSRARLRAADLHGPRGEGRASGGVRRRRGDGCRGSTWSRLRRALCS